MDQPGTEYGPERIFVVIGHRVRTDARFNLNDLCGSTGRLDILLRTINSAFLVSNGIRREVRLYFVLQGEPDAPVTILFKGDELKYLNPDERSTGALVRQALITVGKKSASGPVGGEREGKAEPGRSIGQIHDHQDWVRSTPGIYVMKRGYPELLNELRKEGKVPVYLHETGESINNLDASGIQKMYFVLGDQFDLTEEEESMLGNDAKKVSLGPRVLHTDHCVILIHNGLDLRSTM